MKVCSRCKITKNESEFDKWSLGQSGKRAACKSCRHEEYVSQREKYTEYNRDSRYGVGSHVHFIAQQSKQNGLCAICGRFTDLCLDHCHTTGKWRGALCARCNSGIGDFLDDVSLLIKGIIYLLKWRTKP